MADIGAISEQYLHDNILGGTGDYYTAVKKVYENACIDALLEEVAMAVGEACEVGEEYNGITITTDARHGWRKNSQFTDVVCIGYKTNKVLCDIVVSKEQEKSSQCHEKFGTVKIYNFLENHPECPVNVATHAHDRNLSINKFVREEKPDTVNQNDTWHAGKSVEKEVVAVTKGPKYKHGTTWHEDLFDKSASTRTHIHYAIRNCNGDPEKLKSSILNTVKHYKNIHTECFPESRCRCEQEYRPSKTLIRSTVAEKLFEDALKRTVVYKNPHDFVHALDTFHVESFNNVLNMFHDKRIAFGEKEYLRRSMTAVLHWNENIHRPYSSIWIPPEQRIIQHLGPRANSGKKNYTKRTFVYCQSIWNTFMGQVYQG